MCLLTVPRTFFPEPLDDLTNFSIGSLVFFIETPILVQNTEKQLQNQTFVFLEDIA